MSNKILFIDRDGTLIDEPEDKQIDCVSKLKLKPNVIHALRKLTLVGYQLVMVTNQDGLGTISFPEHTFIAPHELLLEIFASQGIHFADILICPHFAEDRCQCRKPNIGLVLKYLKNNQLDFERSYVIGDRTTDLKFAENIGIKSIHYSNQDWFSIAKLILEQPRTATLKRQTKETNIIASINLSEPDFIDIHTGIGFLDHMIEQIAKHAGFSLQLRVQGDLNIDEHHTVEDTAIVLGSTLKKALGDKIGIQRYGFLLPMDEARAEIALDLSGRSHFIFQGNFNREMVGGLPTELVPHFFHSFADALGAALHIIVTGENAHHMVESIFKGVGRTLRQALTINGHELPTTKGLL